jgi:hypothetical protein
MHRNGGLPIRPLTAFIVGLTISPVGSRRCAKRAQGVLKSLGLGYPGTASGLRTQKCKIKNKKPTTSESPAKLKLAFDKEHNG